MKINIKGKSDKQQFREFQTKIAQLFKANPNREVTASLNKEKGVIEIR